MIQRNPFKDDETIKIEVDPQRKMLIVTSDEENKGLSGVSMQESNQVLIHLWKEARTVINHFDKMMDELRVRTLTIFGTVTSIAIATYYWLPSVMWHGFKIPALIEFIFILVLIPISIQNGLYHYWLYKSINVALNIEQYLYNGLNKKFDKDEIFITSSLTGLPEPRTSGFWSSMLRSKLAWLDFFICLIISGLSVALIYIFMTL
jgi:hypothetical protein